MADYKGSHFRLPSSFSGTVTCVPHSSDSYCRRTCLIVTVKLPRMQPGGFADTTLLNRRTHVADNGFGGFPNLHTTVDAVPYTADEDPHTAVLCGDTKLCSPFEEPWMTTLSSGKGRTPTESSTTSFHTNNGAALGGLRNAKSTLRPFPRELKWGKTGIRSSVLKRLQPPLGDESQESSNDGASHEFAQQRNELRRLLNTLHNALSRLDHRRCLLVLTYLLHARHLVRREVLNYPRCGETVAALTYSTDPNVARCAKTLLKLWRFGLTNGVAKDRLKEVEKRLKCVKRDTS